MIPGRVVSQTEVKRNNGEHGTRKFIAFKSIVYDVTDCPKWLLEMHEFLHFPGQDLSFELEEAPHKEDVFTRSCVKIVGTLKVES